MTGGLVHLWGQETGQVFRVGLKEQVRPALGEGDEDKKQRWLRSRLGEMELQGRWSGGGAPPRAPPACLPVAVVGIAALLRALNR